MNKTDTNGLDYTVSCTRRIFKHHYR